MLSNPPIVVTAPASKPVTLAEAKLFLREDLVDTPNDNQIQMLLDAAIEHIEGQTSRRLITQTLKCTVKGWPRGVFRFPVGPISAISHVRYFDTADAQYTLPSTEYSFDGTSNPPVLGLNYLRTWPSVTLRPLNPVEIQFVAGYADAAAVPARFKNAILMLTATLYRHRSTVTVGNSAAIAALIPQHFQSFLDSLKIHA